MVPSIPLPPAPEFPLPPLPLCQLSKNRNAEVNYARMVLKHIAPSGLDIGYGNCPTWSERFPVSVVSERTRKLIGAGVETVALADLRLYLMFFCCCYLCLLSLLFFVDYLFWCNSCSKEIAFFADLGILGSVLGEAWRPVPRPIVIPGSASSHGLTCKDQQRQIQWRWQIHLENTLKEGFLKTFREHPQMPILQKFRV